MSNIEDKIRKLYTLAKNGEGHEADTAQEMVEKMLAKYGLELADIVDDEPKWEYHKFGNKEEKQILLHVVARTFGTWKVRCDFGRRKNIGVLATVTQQIQIKEECAAYFAELKKQRKALMTAFVNVNNIFPADSEPKKDGESDMSSEDMVRFKAMAFGMAPTSVHRGIE